jgi:hypothetical protein
MAASAARPYDSALLNLDGPTAHIEARDDMPLLRRLRDILVGSGEIRSGHLK